MGWRDRILSRHGLLHRVVRRGALQPEDGDLVAPAADDAELRALRSELAREFERVARGQPPQRSERVP